MNSLWLLGVVLVILAGLNPILGMLALWLAALTMPMVLRPELGWLLAPWLPWTLGALLVLQFLADLYFVPATVRDRGYLRSGRMINSHLNTRFQSLLRPLAAAVALAALPLPVSVQGMAVLGFLAGTGIYWLTAWVREQLAISRGSLILLLAETAKNMIAVVVAALAGWTPPLALAILASLLVTMTWWAARLRREQQLYPAYGGRIAPKDS